jgi:hypothetical protein
MKNMKRFSIIALALIALVSFGCSKDYLSTSPTSSTSPATIFADTDAASLAVNGLNKLMNRQYTSYGQGYNGEGTVRLYAGEYPGHNLYAGALTGFANTMLGELYLSNTASVSGYSWYYYYMLISNANTIIENIDNASGTEAERGFIKAQALCYRAYAYSNLVQLFGKRWKDDQGASKACVLRLSSLDDVELPLSTTAEVYAQIYADLDEAISLFNASGRANSRKDNFTMDLDVAYAIYARVAMAKLDYNKALECANKVINTGSYPLMSNADYKAGFCNPTSEWIWYLYGAEDETLYFYSYFAYIAYNSSAGNCRNYPKCISKELFEKIPATDIRKGLWLDPTGYEGQYNTNTGKANAQKTSNKLYAYAFDYAKKDGRVGLYSTSSVFAYMQFKIRNNAQAGVGNLCLFRTSEMYLIAAEANCMLNNDAAARENLVKLNKNSGRDPQYTCDKSGAALLQEIKDYRGIELWGEGFTWFDLKRWGDSVVRHSYEDGGNFMASVAVTYGPNEKNNWVWVTPKIETDYNKQIF